MSVQFNPLLFSEEAFDFIQRNCTAETEDLSLSDTIARNYEQISSSHRFQQNGQFRGQAFEIIVADAVKKAVGDTPQIRGHVKYANQNAEIDIVIDYGDSVHGLFLKTSLRERWKQEDRDALLFRDGQNHFMRLESVLGHRVASFTPWALVFKERAGLKPQQAVQHIHRMSLFFAGIPAENVMSIYDQQRMERFSNLILS
jgi:hypothetical protein